MKKTDWAVDSIFLFLYEMISTLVIYFAGWMILKILGSIVFIDYFTSAVILAAVTLCGVTALLWVYAYFGSYRSAAFAPAGSILTSVIVIFVHLLFAALFRYEPLIAGYALPLSGILAAGTSFSSADAKALIPGWLPPVLFVGGMLVIHGGMILFRYLGCRKRLRDRAQLTAGKETE